MSATSEGTQHAPAIPEAAGLPLEREIHERIAARIEELAPFAQEYESLVEMKARIEGRSKASQVRSTSGNGDGSDSESRPTPRRRPGPRNGRGQVQAEFLRVVRENPGSLTVSGVAKRLGKEPNYFYRVKDKLVAAGDLEIGAGGELTAKS